MKAFLGVLFSVVLISMIWVTAWAGSQCPLFAVPRPVATHPWFIATLFDAYWGFVTFYLWVAYKQTSLAAKVAWFLAIMSLGNIAMSAYCLAELVQAPRKELFPEILTARRGGPGWLGIALAAAGVAVTVAAGLAPHPTR